MESKPTKPRKKALPKTKGCGSSFGCTNKRTRAAHTCPYQVDIGDNHEPHCHCCVACQNLCADEI